MFPQVPEMYEEAYIANWERGFEQGRTGILLEEYFQKARVLDPRSSVKMGSLEWMSGVGYNAGYTSGIAVRNARQSGTPST